jgi:hypothetical protein
VPRRATISPNADSTCGKIEVIVDNDEIIKADVKSLNQTTDRLSALVHVGLRSGHDHCLGGDFTGADPSLPLFFIKLYAMYFGKMTDTHKAEVMAVMGITLFRIA